MTTPSGSNPVSYGTLGYDSSAYDYWYEPGSSYSGNFQDQFWYAYQDGAGQWSNWALVTINVYADNSC